MALTTKFIFRKYSFGRFLIYTFAAVLMISNFATAADSASSEKKPEAASSLQVFNSVKIPTEGMSCMSCTSSIKKALKGIDGVTDVEVNLVDRAVRVNFLDTKVSAKAIVQKINELGYKTGTPVSPAK